MKIDELYFHNGLFNFPSDRPLKVKTIDDTPNENWKDALAHDMKLIPKGTELVVEVFENFYGVFLKVEYNGWIYYISPYLCDFISVEESE